MAIVFRSNTSATHFFFFFWTIIMIMIFNVQSSNKNIEIYSYSVLSYITEKLVCPVLRE